MPLVRSLLSSSALPPVSLASEYSESWDARKPVIELTAAEPLNIDMPPGDWREALPTGETATSPRVSMVLMTTLARRAALTVDVYCAALSAPDALRPLPK